MKNKNNLKWILLTLFSFISFLIPLSIYVLWLKAFNLGTNQAERVLVFREYFPDFLHGRWDTTIVGLIFSFLAIILSAISLKSSSKLKKFINLSVLICSSMLFILNLISMM